MSRSLLGTIFLKPSNHVLRCRFTTTPKAPYSSSLNKGPWIHISQSSRASQTISSTFSILFSSVVSSQGHPSRFVGRFKRYNPSPEFTPSCWPSYKTISLLTLANPSVTILLRALWMLPLSSLCLPRLCHCFLHQPSRFSNIILRRLRTTSLPHTFA